MNEQHNTHFALSDELKFIFLQITMTYKLLKVFDDLFYYDEENDEYEFAIKTFDIMKYPASTRIFWYKHYPALLRDYKKLGNVYSEKRLIDDIENDNAMPFIPMNAIREETLENRVFHKLLEDDYVFHRLLDIKEIKSFDVHYMVQYDIPSLEMKGWNINIYLQKEFIAICDLDKCSNLHHLLPEYAVRYIYHFNEFMKCLKLFTNDEYNTLSQNVELEMLDPKIVKQIADEIINRHSKIDNGDHKLTDLNLLKYCDMRLFKEFDTENIDVARLMNQRMSDVESKNAYTLIDRLMCSPKVSEYDKCLLRKFVERTRDDTESAKGLCRIIMKKNNITENDV